LSSGDEAHDSSSSVAEEETASATTSRLHPQVFRSWNMQVFLGMLVVFFWITAYAILELILKAVKDIAGSSDTRRTAWFFAFQVTTQLLKSIGKRLGVAVDRGKRGTFSLYFSLEFMTVLFYFTFYRSLFDDIKDPWLFVVFLLMHLLQEWAWYISRGMECSYRLYCSLHRALACWPLVQARFTSLWLPPGVATLRDEQCYLATEMGMRASAAIFSSCGFAIILAMSKDSWTSQQWTLPASMVHDTKQFQSAYFYLLAATVVEVINLVFLHFFLL